MAILCENIQATLVVAIFVEELRVMSENNFTGMTAGIRLI